MTLEAPAGPAVPEVPESAEVLVMRHDGEELSAAPGWSGPDLGAGATFVACSRVSLLHGMPDGDVYRNGQNSWSPTGWTALTSPPLRVADPVRRQTADDSRWDDVVRHHSSWMTAISSGGRALLLGAIAGATPRTHADPDVVAGWTETGEPGLWVVLQGSEQEVFDRYRELLRQRHGTRRSHPGTVWSSWYSLYETVSRAELDSIVPRLPDLGFTTVQIDDGWERRVGDWSANHKFAAGMRDAASSIKALGMRPGLWIAPFITLPGTPVVERYPQMLLRDDDGELVRAGSNWGSHYHTFDFTRPDAQDHLAETIDRLVRGWGFEYLKLDFINAGAVTGCREHDVDREAAYRTAIEIVRRAAGEDTYLLGSGAPVMASLGVLDAVRTGPDVAPMWDNYATDDMSDATARNALRNAVERLWMRGLIGLDPDAVYFRRRRNLLSEEQMAWIRDAATLSDFKAVSDPPGWIEAEDLPALRAFLADSPATVGLGRYRYRIGDREVDFNPALHGAAGAYPL
ncbi:glycoside hydrolase family 36 protein [Desertihabitans aurantiacus]|uniref:glycoside hydrolase family 36 protein n=1 Tax=Desertihabitans aurantiacus TaxID=2282477 RepID=UPI0018E4E20A|nr:glycoside hydrolase family 36 protein [Desertihabitans aurantiacus]